MKLSCPLLAQSRHDSLHRTRPLSGGKADTTFRGSPLLRSLLGVTRTSPFALHMSANDPKRTWDVADRKRKNGSDARRAARLMAKERPIDLPIRSPHAGYSKLY
jgi:hypothetical protein